MTSNNSFAVPLSFSVIVVQFVAEWINMLLS